MGRYFGLKKETSFGAGGVPDQFIRILSETLKFSPNQTYHRSIEGGRKQQTAQSAKESSNGTVKFVSVYDKGLGEFLHMLFGDVQTAETEVATRWTHTFTPLPNITDVINMPSYVMEKGLDSITAERYTGCSCSKMKFNANPADFLTIDADVFGQKPTTQSLVVGPTFSTQNYITQGDIQTGDILIGGAQAKVESMDIEIMGGAIPVWYPANKSISNIDLDPFEAKMNFGARFLTATDLTNFLNNDKPAFEVTWTGPALGAGNYELKLEMPKISWDEGDVTVNEQDRLIRVAGATAIDDGTGVVCRATLVNNVSAY